MNGDSAFWADLVLHLAGFLRGLFVPKTFGALKVRLLTLVVLGLALDVGIKLQLSAGRLPEWPRFTFEIAGPDTAVVIAALVAVSFCVAADLALHLRRLALDRDLVGLAKDPQLDPRLRQAIINAVLIPEHKRQNHRLD